jgi:pyruvate dehydrogenase E2 component (dihydrolipoamide acetyltransferase)
VEIFIPVDPDRTLFRLLFSLTSRSEKTNWTDLRYLFFQSEISMAEVIKMPKMSDTMTEGVIAAWHKKVGDAVKAGDVLAEVETDKATMELESYETGTLLFIGVKEKDAVPVDAVIAIIGKAGENYEALLSGQSGGSVAPVPAVASAPEPVLSAAPAIDLSSIPANVIRMPKMSDTMQEGTIVAWHKKVGDAVKSGELLAEVETDKATMELESYESGTLLYVGLAQGESVKVDAIIAIIGKAGTDYTPLLQEGVSSAAKPVAQASAAAAPVTTAPQAAAVQEVAGGRVKASPLAKQLARELGIDIASVSGSGENGRVVKRDVETFKPETKPAVSAKPASAAGKNLGLVESFEDVPLSQMRKTIARRLSESLYTAPHFYLTMEINMDKAIEARKSIIDFTGSKISFNDMVIKAVASALRQHPKVNASWLGDKIRYNHHIHIGVAVAVEEGLLVPVLRFADSRSLSSISAEVKDLGTRAKNKQLQPADWEGSTFTISNLGMFGIEEFTAIINPPDACILAVGGIKETVIVRNGQFVASNVMKVTLSCDHRVVDGAVGSAFLQTLKGLLEDPVRILA